MKDRKPIKNVLVCGNYGIGNLGDDAILHGITKLIASTWPSAKISVMCSDSVSVHDSHKLNLVRFFPSGFRSFFKFWFSSNCVKTLRALRRSDVVFLGGGGLFNDEKWQSILIWFTQFFWFWVYRKPVACIAQSVGPLSKWWSRRLVKFVFKSAKLVTVRDERSAKLLRELGIKDVHVLTDPAFAIGYESSKSAHRQDQIVLSVRPWHGHDCAEVYKEIAQTIDVLFQKEKINAVFLAFQTQIENDVESFNTIHGLLRNKEALKLQNVDDHIHALEVIGRSKMVMGMRLHSIIFATLTATPFVAISYTKKVKDFVEMINMEEFLQNSKSLQSSELVNIIGVSMANFSDISKKLEREKLKNTYTFFEHEELLNSIFSPDN